MLLKMKREIGAIILLSACTADPADEQNKPSGNDEQNNNDYNFVVIMMDDVCYDMFGCYECGGYDMLSTLSSIYDGISTPNIDRLASDGVFFQTAWSSALSGPARAQMMTGKYATTTGAWSNGFFRSNNNGKQLFQNHTAFSRVLHDGGYRTAVAGKWNIGSAEGQYDPILGFDTYAIWTSAGELVSDYGILETWSGGVEEDGGTARYWHPCIVQNGELLQTVASDFGPDIFTKFICDFIDESAAEGAKFLAYYPMVLPHGPRVLMPGATTDYSNINQNSDANFVSMINYIDLLVGRIVEQLEVSGVVDDTLIIITADNGTAVTAKSRGVERGSHVPMVISGRGVVQRGESAEICDTSDIFPTLIDYAGLQIPECDGVSLKPYLSGVSDSHKDLIHACIDGTQLLRTREYMMEVVSPILGLDKGRFYYCGSDRVGYGYIRAEDESQHAEIYGEFLDVLSTKYIGLKESDECMQDGDGQSFLQDCIDGREKHIYNHDKYKIYDEEIRLSGSATTAIDEVYGGDVAL